MCLHADLSKYEEQFRDPIFGSEVGILTRVLYEAILYAQTHGWELSPVFVLRSSFAYRWTFSNQRLGELRMTSK